MIMNNENCDKAEWTEKDDNIKIISEFEEVQTNELEIQKSNNLELPEINKHLPEESTEINNADSSKLEENTSVENGVIEEAKKDLLDSIVDEFNDVIKDSMETDLQNDLKEIEKQVESAIQELERNECANISMEVDLNSPKACSVVNGDEVKSNELDVFKQLQLHSDDMQRNDLVSLPGLLNCDEEDIRTSEPTQLTNGDQFSSLRNNDETISQSNIDEDISDCIIDDKTNENDQPAENCTTEEPSIGLAVTLQEISNSVSQITEKNTTVTSILEATLTMGKKNETTRNIVNGILNIPPDVSSNLEDTSKNILIEPGDDEIDLFTPMITVDEMPPNTKQEPIDSELDANKNDVGVNKSPQINSNSIQKSGTVTSLPIQDLIVREFCLQQDSLCNLVSASIESTLNMDSVEKGDQDESFVQHLLLAEPGITSFIAIEDIFKQVKQFTSTEYLLLYAKIQLKCFEFDPSLFKTVVDIKRKSKINLHKTENGKVQQIAKKCLSNESLEKVEKIMEVISTISPSECLFLHNALPKAYKAIKDVLQKTTICCRPIVSQTVMWLKTHYEEAPTVLISKPDVFRNYNMFCAKNAIKPCGVPDFGKMIKRTFINIFHRRQVIRGKTQYFYCGLKPCYKLPVPKPPKLSDKTSVVNESYSCSKCCTIYAYMHNLKFRMKPSKAYVNLPGNEAPSKKVNRTVNKENGKSKGAVINGKPVVVHDPLELLSLSMNDNSNSQPSLTDHTYVQVKSVQNVAVKRTVKKATVKEYKNTKLLGKSRSRGRVIKVKYKQYRHPSVKNIMDTYKDITLSHDLFKINMNPVVRLENQELHNWCGEKIKNFIDQLSNLSIVKVSDNLKLKIKYRCCNTSTKVSQLFGDKLKDLKKELENIKITCDNRTDNYSITYFLSPSQLPLISETNNKNNLCPVSKRLGFESNSNQNDRQGRIKTHYFPSIRNKHHSVDNLFKKIDSLTFPEEIINTDIDPVIVLNSQEVIDWYAAQLKTFEEPVDAENEEMEVFVDDNAPITPRESRAKMMNFCESDSCDSADVPPSENNQGEDPTLDNSGENKCADDSTQQDNEQRPPDPECEGPLRKKVFHLSDIINDSENRVSIDAPECDPKLSDSELCKSELRCFFCSQDFKTPKELSNHREIHLRCRTCKRRMPSEDAMRVHLIKHCFMNNALCAPNLILSRVDQPEPIETYPLNLPIIPSHMPNILSKKKVFRRKSINSSNYPTSVLNFNNVNHNIDQLVLPIVPNSLVNDNHNRKARSSQLSAKSQKSSNHLRFARPVTAEVSHFQITANNFKDIPDGQTLQQSTSQLKSTISNNFNRIFLLSNNNSPSQHESPNIVYGLYLNNRTDQSTPICLNNYSRIGSDCALNTNPSCSIAESTNFMQIVETPNTGLPPYDASIITETSVAPFEQHQDHSYYQQQPVFTINNEVSNLNNGLLNGVSQENMHSNSLFEMSYLNNINTDTRPCSEPLLSATPKIENTNPLPPPVPGPFRIRVKDIRELS
ncbi:hypothetical protein RI129_003204 [Pyrocoelia pectoralis]|uniref:RFX-type winged-helix domain-containing protein n=1 Tax=Pyrocoelia pectoralis TaxID=417401 RepID=A0AAN7VHP8_9COLE